MAPDISDKCQARLFSSRADRTGRSNRVDRAPREISITCSTLTPIHKWINSRKVVVCNKYELVIGILWKSCFGYGNLNHDQHVLVLKVNSTVSGHKNINCITSITCPDKHNFLQILLV